MTTEPSLTRVDFTYYPQTGIVEWHAHEDLPGDGPLLNPSPEMVTKALEAFATEVTQRRKRAAWWDRMHQPARCH